MKNERINDLFCASSAKRGQAHVDGIDASMYSRARGCVREAKGRGERREKGGWEITYSPMCTNIPNGYISCCLDADAQGQ